MIGLGRPRRWTTMNHPSERSRYGAHFYMQVEGPDLEDPVEAAAIARHEGAYNLRGVWVITAGDVEYVVDLTEGKVLSERPRDYIRKGPNGCTEIRRIATGPDGLPMEVWVRVESGGRYHSP